MTRPDLDPVQVAAFFARDPETDRYHDLVELWRTLPADEALGVAVELANLAPDDDRLCWVGVAYLEPLVEVRWMELGSGLERALASSGRLRKAMSCVWLSDVPEETRRQIDALIGPDEQLD